MMHDERGNIIFVAPPGLSATDLEASNGSTFDPTFALRDRSRARALCAVASAPRRRQASGGLRLAAFSVFRKANSLL